MFMQMMLQARVLALWAEYTKYQVNATGCHDKGQEKKTPCLLTLKNRKPDGEISWASLYRLMLYALQLGFSCCRAGGEPTIWTDSSGIWAGGTCHQTA